MRRLTAKKLEVALFQIALCIECENIAPADRARLIEAGTLLDDLWSRAASPADHARLPSFWLEFLARQERRV